MRNLAVLTARLSGRPLFMREEDAHAWAHRLMSLDANRDDRPKGFKGLFGRAKAMKNVEPAPADMINPQMGCATPLWMGPADDTGFGWVLKDNIAVITVEGPLLDEGYVSEWSDYMIAGYDTLSQTFDEVQADPRVQGLFYRLKSPGGLAAQGLPDLCDKMRARRIAGGGSKPIYMFAETACSACYWIFASGDRGFAPPMGSVGSIGAVSTHCDMSGMYAKDGIVMTPIQFGAKKTDGAAFKPLSDTAQADWQSEIDYLGNMFVDGVIAGRPNLSRDAVLATEAACYVAGNTDQARSALALGLVDEIATEEVAFAALKAAIATMAAARQASLFPLASAAKANAVRPALESPMRDHQAASPENPVTEPDDGNEICETCNGTGDADDGTDCPDCGGDGQVEIIDQGEKTAIAAVPAPALAAAHAIAGSAEAKARPEAALAAISAGLSFEQFRTMAAVAPTASASESAIDRRMLGAQRLGVDAPAGGGEGGSTMGAALVADAKAKAAKST